MEKPLMRSFQAPQNITGSAGAMAVAAPANMVHDSRQPGDLWSYAVYALVAIGCVVVG